ncbi:Hypothetical predicted protein [Pelobates cultripes]|uniref:Uncharacterized protein n=1 Tax=Pelobates cultripes TaxID=61616 RepID=A0AAD1VS73_PELCU|nr:Hypothetical predicted protein [Pelobates cultripes]
MHTLLGCMKSVEDELTTAHQAQLKAAILTQQLTQQHTALTRHVASLEDTMRRRNLKSQELSSNIGTEELPQFT